MIHEPAIHTRYRRAAAAAYEDAINERLHATIDAIIDDALPEINDAIDAVREADPYADDMNFVHAIIGLERAARRAKKHALLYRVAAGDSQKELATALGLTRPTLCRWVSEADAEREADDAAETEKP